jgi:hypothetical protein
LAADHFQTLACDTAAVTVTYAVDLGGFAASDLTYRWTVDGILLPDTGSSITTTLQNNPAGQLQQHVIKVEVESGDGCDLIKDTVFVDVPGCSGCPTVTGISISLSPVPNNCIGNGAQVTVDFAAVLSANTPTSYGWTFGDGSSQTTLTPNVSHQYTLAGPYTAQVTSHGPGSCTSTYQVQVTIPTCPPIQNGNGGGEGLACGVARILIVLLLALGLVALIFATCPPLVGMLLLTPTVMIGIGVGLLVAAGILLLAWLLLCPTKPCGWGWLLAWQTLLTAALIVLHFLTCCPHFLIVGLILILLSIVPFIGWIRKCKPSLCRIFGELLAVIGGLVIPVINVARAIPLISACISPIVHAIVGVIVGIISARVAMCLAKR